MRLSLRIAFVRRLLALARGWPQTFIGDLYYYTQDYDLREQAHEIDTSGLGVHILSGEYDYSVWLNWVKLHQAIAGSTFTFAKGVIIS